MKINKKAYLVVIFTFFLIITGCANLTSINRTNSLPEDKYEQKGKIIHLDAKQRVVYASGFGALCAEPSPDALAAFAHAISGSVTSPQQVSGALTSALQENAGSIGVRTQSIQLMRDSLYRVCEAYYGRALTSAEVMQLHARYQNVLVGILAIEQLTGAVLAKQIILGGASSATAASRLAQVDGLLENAVADENRRKEQLVQAKASREALKNEVATKQADLNKLQAAEPPTDPQILTERQTELKNLQNQLVLADQNVASADRLAKQATQTRESIEKNRGAALASSDAAAAGSGHFSTTASIANLDTESTKAISKAVTDIVEMIVTKDYIVDSCILYLARVLDPEDHNGQATAKGCSKIVQYGIQNRLSKLN